MICNKCANEIPELNFYEEFLLEIRYLAFQDMKLFLVKQLINQGVIHRDAKLIADHFNPISGSCLHCNFEGLQGENIACPKCGAFNYNLMEPPFNQAFCECLEWAIDFDRLEIEEVKGFWCDGIDAFPSKPASLSKANILRNRQIITEARVGKDGQDLYCLTIQLGSKSLRYYELGLNMKNGIPKNDCSNWVVIDPQKKKMLIKLD